MFHWNATDFTLLLHKGNDVVPPLDASNPGCVFFYNYLAYSFIRGFCVASASVTHQLTVLASYAAAVLASTCI